MDEENAERTQNDIRALKQLFESRGWAIIVEIVKAQTEQRKELILLPRDQQPDEFKIEFLRGEIAGMRMFVELAKTELENRQFDKEVEDGSEHPESE